MASRPSNIGIKAIELYFPSQVGSFFALGIVRCLTECVVCRPG